MPFRKLLFGALIIAMIFGAFLLFRMIKTNWVMEDYFSQGRWGMLKEQYNDLDPEIVENILFGNSTTENFKNHMEGLDVVNMGISGDFSEGLIRRAENVTQYQPEKVFIMIGTNDIIEKVPLNDIKSNYASLIDTIQKLSPATKIYIQSTLPVRDISSIITSTESINDKVQELNSYLRK